MADDMAVVRRVSNLRDGEVRATIILPEEVVPILQVGECELLQFDGILYAGSLLPVQIVMQVAARELDVHIVDDLLPIALIHG